MKLPHQIRYLLPMFFLLGLGACLESSSDPQPQPDPTQEQIERLRLANERAEGEAQEQRERQRQADETERQRQADIETERQRRADIETERQRQLEALHQSGNHWANELTWGLLNEALIRPTLDGLYDYVRRSSFGDRVGEFKHRSVRGDGSCWIRVVMQALLRPASGIPGVIAKMQEALSYLENPEEFAEGQERIRGLIQIAVRQERIRALIQIMEVLENKILPDQIRMLEHVKVDIAVDLGFRSLMFAFSKNVADNKLKFAAFSGYSQEQYDRDIAAAATEFDWFLMVGNDESTRREWTGQDESNLPIHTETGSRYRIKRPWAGTGEFENIFNLFSHNKIVILSVRIPGSSYGYDESHAINFPPREGVERIPGVPLTMDQIQLGDYLSNPNSVIAFQSGGHYGILEWVGPSRGLT